MKKDNSKRKYIICIVGVEPPQNYVATVYSYKKAVKRAKSDIRYRVGTTFRIECHYGNGKCETTLLLGDKPNDRQEFDWFKAAMDKKYWI